MARKTPFQRNPERAARGAYVRQIQAENADRATRWAQQPRFFRDFDSYCALFPEAEVYRRWLVTCKSIHVPSVVESPQRSPSSHPAWNWGRYLVLVQGDGPHGGLPGNYLWANITYRQNTPCPYVVCVHDCDDGCVIRTHATLAAAEAALDELCDLAPCTMDNLAAFGYQFAV